MEVVQFKMYKSDASNNRRTHRAGRRCHSRHQPNVTAVPEMEPPIYSRSTMPDQNRHRYTAESFISSHDSDYYGPRFRERNIPVPVVRDFLCAACRTN